MDAYRISPDDGLLNDLVDRAEAGESVELAREGRVVARLVRVARQTKLGEPFDLPAYLASIKDMPVYPGNSVIDMRKEARY